MVGGPDIAAEDVLDDLVALVHRLLDQRVAAERADHVEAADARLVAGRQRRQRQRVRAREGDAAGFDKAPRRRRADAGDHAVAGDARLAIGRAEHQHVGARRAGLGHLDGQDIAAVVAADSPGVDCLGDQLEVAILDTRELVAAVDDHDLVLRGERHRILDCRVAGADHDDHFIAVLVRIVELVLHAGQVAARHLEAAQVSLHADREDHRVRRDRLLACDLEPETLVLRAGSR